MLGCVYGLDEDRTFVKAPGFEQRVGLRQVMQRNVDSQTAVGGGGHIFQHHFLSYASACSL
jgi:hypothetical protein